MRRAAAAAAATLILTAASAPTALAARYAGPAPDSAPAIGAPPALPVAVTLDSIRPYAPQPGQTLTLVVTADNVSAAPIGQLSATLQLSRQRVQSRSQFDQYAADPAGGPPVAAVAPAGVTATIPHATLAVGAAEQITLTVPVDNLQPLTAWQVYEFAVVVSGATPTGMGPVGQVRSFLPYAPVNATGVGVPTRVAWLWPLVDRPHRAGDEWLDSTLAGELAPRGRLTGLVAAADVAGHQHSPLPPRQHGHHRHRSTATQPRASIQPVPVTWAIDPLLLEDATAMSSGYRVGSGKAATAGPGAAAAKDWLTRLLSALGGDDVLSLPYADPDIVAATRNGLGKEVLDASTLGQSLLEHILGRTPITAAWPPDGYVDQRGLDTLFEGGVTTVVLDSNALPIIGGEPSETPSAHATVGGRFRNFDALLSDDRLDQVIATGAIAPESAAAGVQRLLSELLLIQAELPSDPRSIVLTPPRRWAPTASYARALLTATGQVPWIEPVSLSAVAASPVYTKVRRGPLVYPPSAREQQLRPGYLRTVRAIKRDVDAFAAILPTGAAQPREFNAGVLRLLSSAWRTDPGDAKSARNALQQQVKSTMGKVRIASASGEVTLTSHSGTVPVTVENDLDVPVRLAIRIAPSAHLVVQGGGVVKTIQPHRSVPVDVRATARTSGVFPLVVSLFTPGGDVRYGQPVQLFVRSTAYGFIALLITGGATAVLLLAVGARLVRRIRAARRATAAA